MTSRGSGYTQPPGWTATVKRILARDHHTCYACGGPATTADHLIPVARGGAHEDGNLGAMCAPCHAIKSERERREGFAMRRPRVKRERRQEQHPNARPNRT